MSNDGSTGAATGKGRTTLRMAGVMFIISAVLELFSVGSTGMLAGSMLSGVPAAAYHLVFAAMYLAVGIGLWGLKPWAYPVTLAAVALYTIDQLAFIADPASVEAWVEMQLGGMQGMAGLDELVDKGQIADMARLMAMVILVCWWGFAAYVVHRRRLFKPDGD